MSKQANRDRILYLLKTRGPQTAQDLAETLDMTSMGARGHLEGLQEDGLLDVFDQKQGRGRPRRFWQLTDKAWSRFPDRHSELIVDLLGGLQQMLGDDAMDRLIQRRETDSLNRYQSALGNCPTLEDKLAALAKVRSDEGYMAEWATQPDGSYLLLENHCPICAAARQCQGFCRSELDQFQQLLAPAQVSRVEHQLDGARRCAYRIWPD